MSGTLRKLKRLKDADELPIAQQKLPIGRLLTDPMKGEFVSFPLLGWVAVRHRDRIPLVMLRLALLRSEKGAEGIKGLLQVELPVYADTEAATVAALGRYGWSGRCWKEGDEHWPSSDEAALEQLRGLMAHAGLRMSLTFPPDPATGDNKAQSVEVTRAKGSFLMPPLEEPTKPPRPDQVNALRDVVLAYGALCQDAPDA